MRQSRLGLADSGVGEHGLEDENEPASAGDKCSGEDCVSNTPLRQRNQNRQRPRQHPVRLEVDDLKPT